MIDEIYRLQELLDRIILVSHQEEFATRFNNSWQTHLENGATRLALL